MNRGDSAWDYEQLKKFGPHKRPLQDRRAGGALPERQPFRHVRESARRFRSADRVVNMMIRCAGGISFEGVLVEDQSSSHFGRETKSDAGSDAAGK
jgi:hypothetical protein